jgi:hypothetical protein
VTSTVCASSSASPILVNFKIHFVVGHDLQVRNLRKLTYTPPPAHYVQFCAYRLPLLRGAGLRYRGEGEQKCTSGGEGTSLFAKRRSILEGKFAGD